MKRVKTKEPFITKAHRVICKKPDEIIKMPDEDYEEVKGLVILVDEKKSKPVKLKQELDRGSS